MMEQKVKQIFLLQMFYIYDLNDNSWCCVRPSGTEPKIKFYMGVKGKSMLDAEDKLNELTEAMKKYVE